jgi:3-dehydroquinate dehydratase-1
MHAPTVKIGTVAFAWERPRVIAPFTDKTPHDAIYTARDYGIDLLEARIDQFESYEPSYVVDRIATLRAEIPIVATIRSQKEGGRWTGSEDARVSLFSALIPEVDAIDIELSAAEIAADVVKMAKKNAITPIVSFHDFKTTPSFETLSRIVEQAKALGAEIVKVATTPLSILDMQALARLTIAKAADNIVVIGMGSEGLKTRLLFPALGSLMTYAFIDTPTAPGQLSVRDTFEYLKIIYPENTRNQTNAATP